MITIKFEALKRAEKIPGKFNIPDRIKEELHITNLSEVINLIIDNDYYFNSFTLLEGTITTEPIQDGEDLTGLFITRDNKEFYLVDYMYLGEDLYDLNRSVRTFDKRKTTAFQLTNSNWDRIDEYQKVTPLEQNKKLKEWLNEKNKKLLSERAERDNLLKRTANFTGHRPDKLGGYNMKNPTMLMLKAKLLEVIEDLIVNHNIDRFISGGALGTDTAAFWCVHILKEKYPHIKNILAVPFEKQDSVWSDEQKYWYQKMKRLADEVIYVDTVSHYAERADTPVGEYSGYKMQIRNEYMVDHAYICVGVYNGTKGGTENCLRYAKGRNRLFYILDPNNDFEFRSSYDYK